MHAAVQPNATTTDDVTYLAFKNTVLTLHEQQVGAEADTFEAITSGLQLLREWSLLFPEYATQLADDPEFLYS